MSTGSGHMTSSPSTGPDSGGTPFQAPAASGTPFQAPAASGSKGSLEPPASSTGSPESPADSTAPPPERPPTRPPPRATKRASSLVLVATGDGKGKTTAAMGTALRALARGWPVCVVQFVKSGKWHSGEGKALTRLGAEWHTMGEGFTWDSDDLGRSAEVARMAWQLAKQKISSGEYRLVVLDEVTYPLNWGWVPVQDLVETVAGRPQGVNVFITGRDAPQAVVSLADTVSEVRKLKHPYEAGIMAMKGIDF
jgi:cob(I)alamin adenosyltransferase